MGSFRASLRVTAPHRTEKGGLAEGSQSTPPLPPPAGWGRGVVPVGNRMGLWGIHDNKPQSQWF